MNYVTFEKKCLVVVFAIIICCIGCASSDDDDFVVAADLQERNDALKLLFTENMYNTITEKSRNNLDCRESNRATLGLSDLPNGEWYYTYDNLIAGMAKMEQFASEGDDNTNKLEIAAFLANIAQETGTGIDLDPTYGGPGCFIQEVNQYGSTAYNSSACGIDYTCAAAGYIGRGPHQLSWDTNYKSFGETMGVGLEYVTDPDILTKDHEIGIAGSIWFWGHAEHASGWPSNIPYKPSAHNVIVSKWTPTDRDVTCGRTQAGLGIITNIINGGLECGNRSSAVGRENAAKRVTYFNNIAAVMGVTVPDGWADNCTGQQDFEECPSYRNLTPTTRCGLSWAEAQSKCGTYCQSDVDCSNDEKCFANLSRTPCPN
ncbi:MAG: chitinase [Pseudomonadota bacterium]